MKTLEIVNGQINLNSTLTGKDCLKQRIKNRLSLFYAEWVLFQSEGVDWLSVLGRRDVTAQEYINLARKEILKDSEVISINTLNVEFVDNNSKKEEFENTNLRTIGLRTAVFTISLNTIYGVLNLSI